MNMKFQDGLLFTSIQLSFRGNTKVIENIVIDTGAAETIISPDAVEDIGIFAELEDNVNSFYGVGGSLVKELFEEPLSMAASIDSISMSTAGPIYRLVIGKDKNGRSVAVWVDNDIVYSIYMDQGISKDKVVGTRREFTGRYL
ncbi:hypothetical protein UF75_4152 [Desulfosporosinus sp. I2]|uniref:hypothetical protein n=1 Tax=Desulfosporosinus sp. I2 TaxID=1617025 RepID=UPI00061E9CCE|nr:hypothetical protein [Desulfosporosinus sp. I2]KJR45476.1 hypothetical protein UF75_4152 [Desulfosporosinus sp. I2]